MSNPLFPLAPASASLQDADLPDGWVVLSSETDILPRVGSSRVKGLTATVPVLKEGDTVFAFVQGEGSSLAKVDTTDWSGEDWLAQGRRYVPTTEEERDAQKYSVALNYGESVAVSTGRGLLFYDGERLVVSASGDAADLTLQHDYISNIENGHTAVPSGGLFHVDVAVLKFDRPGAVPDGWSAAYDQAERRMLARFAFVRKTASRTEVRHFEDSFEASGDRHYSYDRRFRIRELDETEESGMIRGRWYNLTYKNENVYASEVADGAQGVAFQAVVEYVYPFGGFARGDAGFLKLVGEHADAVPTDLSWLFVVLGVSLVALALIVAPDADGWAAQPAVRACTFAVGAFLAVYFGGDRHAVLVTL